MKNMNGEPTTKKNVLRQRPRLLYAGLNTNGEGWLSEPHTHEHPELALIGAGTGKIKVAGETYPFRRGDLIIFSKNVLHTEYMDPVAGREMYFWALGNLRLAGLEPDALLRDKPFCIIPTESYFDTLLALVRTMIAETESKQPFHDAITDHLVKTMLLYVLRIADFDVNLTFKQNDTYLEAKKYFDEHFTDIQTLDNVCKSLYINKYYLSHVFKEQMGIPPIKYLINKRIELACRYLETTDMNIGDIARACGYVDTAYFCRVFKNVQAVTPLRYRFNYKQRKKDS